MHSLRYVLKKLAGHQNADIPLLVGPAKHRRVRSQGCKGEKGEHDWRWNAFQRRSEYWGLRINRPCKRYVSGCTNPTHLRECSETVAPMHTAPIHKQLLSSDRIHSAHAWLFPGRFFFMVQFGVDVHLAIQSVCKKGLVALSSTPRGSRTNSSPCNARIQSL